ncbi:refractory to sigma P isoform X2 [Andrena cerasifolii]|uniref:refractory to sigma P isoform X2 n=1 Tax=Andrena cerasifolii TaxID=2819439 RepID=UPI0040379E8E
MLTVEFKVYLQNSDSTVKEIRRFKLDRQATYDFTYLCQTLMYYFPEIRGKDFDISWIDADNDVILITSNEELEIASEYFRSSVKKLYIKLGPRKQEMRTFKKEGVVHFNIYCDHCDRGISGMRYKCIQCEDYDLCSECETSGAHAKHYMIRMPRPLEWSSYHGRRLLHHMKKFFKRDDINIEIIPETPNAPESNKAEKKEESEGSVPTVENPAAKVPEEGSKPDTSTDVEGSMSNSKSPVMNAEAPVKKTATTEGWTMIDKNEASGLSYASSVSSNLSETSEKHDSASLPSAPKEHASCQTMYPHLEEEDEQIYSANPRIRAATEAMIKMGFSNKGGLLTHLLEVEDCNINKVLDLLQSNSSKSGV